MTLSACTSSVPMMYSRLPCTTRRSCRGNSSSDLILIVFLLAAFQTAPAVNDAQRLYIVGPNDVLTITVYNQAQLSGKFVVEADGTFAYPLLGRLAAGGLSIRAVEDK